MIYVVFQNVLNICIFLTFFMVLVSVILVKDALWLYGNALERVGCSENVSFKCCQYDVMRLEIKTMTALWNGTILLISLFSSSYFISCCSTTQILFPAKKSGPWLASSPALALWGWISQNGWLGNFSAPWPRWGNPLFAQTPPCTWYAPPTRTRCGLFLVWCSIQMLWER